MRLQSGAKLRRPLKRKKRRSKPNECCWAFGWAWEAGEKRDLHTRREIFKGASDERQCVFCYPSESRSPIHHMQISPPLPLPLLHSCQLLRSFRSQRSLLSHAWLVPRVTERTWMFQACLEVFIVWHRLFIGVNWRMSVGLGSNRGSGELRRLCHINILGLQNSRKTKKNRRKLSWQTLKQLKMSSNCYIFLKTNGWSWLLA